jgi:hypothetical protein
MRSKTRSAKLLAGRRDQALMTSHALAAGLQPLGTWLTGRSPSRPSERLRQKLAPPSSRKHWLLKHQRSFRAQVEAAGLSATASQSAAPAAVGCVFQLQGLKSVVFAADGSLHVSCDLMVVNGSIDPPTPSINALADLSPLVARFPDVPQLFAVPRSALGPVTSSSEAVACDGLRLVAVLHGSNSPSAS